MLKANFILVKSMTEDDGKWRRALTMFEALRPAFSEFDDSEDTGRIFVSPEASL